MKVVSIIPARYESQRFPAKLMHLLGKKTVILSTYENVLATGLFDQVLVATDSEIIYKEIFDNGGKAVMTKTSHHCGSDRIAEAVMGIDTDIVVNVQGDEPLIDHKDIIRAIDLKRNTEPETVKRQLYKYTSLESSFSFTSTSITRESASPVGSVDKTFLCFT